jgi:hypothetical protein
MLEGLPHKSTATPDVASAKAAIDPQVVSDMLSLWRPPTQPAEHQQGPIVLAQGLPGLRDWLQQGLGGSAPRRGSSDMNDNDWAECQRMSSQACQNYQRMNPRDRDYRNRLPNNERYDFDRDHGLR